jgi:hypothetical protein
MYDIMIRYVCAVRQLEQFRGTSKVNYPITVYSILKFSNEICTMGAKIKSPLGNSLYPFRIFSHCYVRMMKVSHDGFCQSNNKEMYKITQPGAYGQNNATTGRVSATS